MKKFWISMLCAAMLSGCGSAASAASTETAAPSVPYSCRVMDYYDYNNPVPQSDAVEESYYDDVLLAGDSRMGSMYLYGTHPNAEVEYVTSLNLLLIDMMPLDQGDGSETLMDVLNQTKKNNIYLLFGINEIRNASFDPFAEKYQEIITALRTQNPSVNIYIILSYHPDYISDLPEPALTTQLTDLNNHLINLAKTNYTYYLVPDEGLDDTDGTIKDDYTFDGLHLTPNGTVAFQNYLDTHVARSNVYVKEMCE